MRPTQVEIAGQSYPVVMATPVVTRRWALEDDVWLCTVRTPVGDILVQRQPSAKAHANPD